MDCAFKLYNIERHFAICSKTCSRSFNPRPPGDRPSAKVYPSLQIKSLSALTNNTCLSPTCSHLHTCLECCQRHKERCCHAVGPPTLQKSPCNNFTLLVDPLCGGSPQPPLQRVHCNNTTLTPSHHSPPAEGSYDNPLHPQYA